MNTYEYIEEIASEYELEVSDEYMSKKPLRYSRAAELLYDTDRYTFEGSGIDRYRFLNIEKDNVYCINNQRHDLLIILTEKATGNKVLRCCECGNEEILPLKLDGTDSFIKKEIKRNKRSK